MTEKDDSDEFARTGLFLSTGGILFRNLLGERDERIFDSVQPSEQAQCHTLGCAPSALQRLSLAVRFVLRRDHRGAYASGPGLHLQLPLVDEYRETIEHLSCGVKG